MTADLRLPPAVIAFWWPRFERIARWFVGVERARRTGLAASHTEIRGSVVLDAPGGPFRLTAVADRIDRFADGSFAILDYKTGSPQRPRHPARHCAAIAAGSPDPGPGRVRRHPRCHRVGTGLLAAVGASSGRGGDPGVEAGPDRRRADR
ncbi:PD-(D/E)XK nuclease family protein [Tistrella bauzanensis]